jgi:uncharacterized protein YrrD
MTALMLAQLIDIPVLADDGAVGRVIDAYFDEREWQIRFLLVAKADADAQGSSVVLIPAQLVTGVDPEADQIHVSHFPEAARSVRPDAAVETLRSARCVRGCRVSGWGNSLGETEDAIFETTTWALRYLLVNASSWYVGTHFLVRLELVDELCWEDNALRVAVTRDEILNAPDDEDAEPDLGRAAPNLH